MKYYEVLADYYKALVTLESLAGEILNTMNPSDEQRVPPEHLKKGAGQVARNALFFMLLMIALGEAAYIFREQLERIWETRLRCGHCDE